jgi:hypothetical protein
MSTDWIASVRPVKSTKSVTSRTTGLLTGIVTASDLAISGGFRAQPGSTAMVAQSKMRRQEVGEVMAWRSRAMLRDAANLVVEKTTRSLTRAPHFRFIVW